MYVVDYSEENEGYRCFQPTDPAIGTASSSSSLTSTLDSGASRSFFRDRNYPYAARPAGLRSPLLTPSGGPVLSHFSTVLPCPGCPFGHPVGSVPSLVLYELGEWSGPAGCGGSPVHSYESAGDPLHGGTHRADTCHVAASGQVLAAAASRSGPESAPLFLVASCLTRLSCRTTVLATPPCPVFGAWLPVSLSSGPSPQSLPPLPSGPGPFLCPPCVEGRLRATPHSLHFPPRQRLPCRRFTWIVGPSPRPWAGLRALLSCWWLNDYSRYTTVPPLHSKGAVTEVLIDWIREARLPSRKELRLGLSLFLPSALRTRGGEFLFSPSCGTTSVGTGDPPDLHAFPDSPQQNGIAERRIGMVMDVRSFGDASVVPFWGSQSVCPATCLRTSLSPRAAPCVFLGFPTDAPGWQF
ncbi:unnamed protein product [Closterium sp. NIES-65]|nr:unnamed protein product [Closterium sp. NIES-65]